MSLFFGKEKGKERYNLREKIDGYEKDNFTEYISF